MNKQELLDKLRFNDSSLFYLKDIHPLQIIGDNIKIPLWEIKYRYKTNRGNDKEAIKYISLDESSWDLVEIEFNCYIDEFNETHPDRMLSNVEILETNYLGYGFLELE